MIKLLDRYPAWVYNTLKRYPEGVLKMSRSFVYERK